MIERENEQSAYRQLPTCLAHSLSQLSWPCLCIRGMSRYAGPLHDFRRWEISQFPFRTTPISAATSLKWVLSRKDKLPGNKWTSLH